MMGLSELHAENETAAKRARIVAGAKKKRAKKTSPTARSLAECRRLGWIADVVEQTIHAGRLVFKRDLFRVIDIVAIVVPANGERGRTIGIQATGGDHSGVHAKRRAKILAEWKASAWLAAGNELEIWSWEKQGAHGKRKLWTLRREAITLEMFVGDGEPIALLVKAIAEAKIAHAAMTEAKAGA